MEKGLRLVLPPSLTLTVSRWEGGELPPVLLEFC